VAIEDLLLVAIEISPIAPLIALEIVSTRLAPLSINERKLNM